MLQVVGTSIRIVSFVNEVQLHLKASSKIADDPAEVVVLVNKGNKVLKEQNRANIPTKSFLKVNVLNFDCHIVATFSFCSKDLRERSSGDRLIIKLGEYVVRRVVEIFHEQSIHFIFLPLQALVFQQLQGVSIFNWKNVVDGSDSLSDLDI